MSKTWPQFCWGIPQEEFPRAPRCRLREEFKDEVQRVAPPTNPITGQAVVTQRPETPRRSSKPAPVMTSAPKPPPMFASSGGTPFGGPEAPPGLEASGSDPRPEETSQELHGRWHAKSVCSSGVSAELHVDASRDAPEGSLAFLHGRPGDAPRSVWPDSPVDLLVQMRHPAAPHYEQRMADAKTHAIEELRRTSRLVALGVD